MKPKKLFTILMLLGLLIAPSFAVYSQTNNSSIVSTDETISFLLTENSQAKDLIEKQTTRIRDLEAEVAAEQENSASIGKSYESAKIEIGFLRQSNEALTRAVAVNQQTIELLKADNSKQRENVKKANRAKWKAIAVAAVAVGIKLLIP